MKKILLGSLILLAGSTMFAQSRDRQAPTRVQKTFQHDYPDARDPHWNNTNGQWHADFNDGSRYDRGEMTAHYDQQGRHIDSHIPYDRNDVPAPVVNRTERRYPGARDYEYTRIERGNNRNFYRVKLRHQGRYRTLYMDDNGRDKQYSDRHP